jgi:ketosteroid isomerase-like protein
MLKYATTLIGLLAVLASPTPEAEVPKDVRAVLEEYRAAMEARSVDRLSKVVDPALVVVENTGINVGWADYRDNHIGPELKEMRSFKYLGPRVVDASVSGDTAHAVVEARVEIAEEREVVMLACVETFVLRKTKQGWKIRSLHWSGKRVPPDAGAPVRPAR